MYKVSIYDKSKKMIAVYERIRTIKYMDILGDTFSISGDDILTHEFPTYCNYHLYSDNGNYSIDKSIIGTFEVEKVNH